MQPETFPFQRSRLPSIVTAFALFQKEAGVTDFARLSLEDVGARTSMGAGVSHNFKSAQEARDAGIPQSEIDAWLAANDFDIPGLQSYGPPSPPETPEQVLRKQMDWDG